MRQFPSAYPVGVDSPDKIFKGTVRFVHRNGWGWLRCPELPDDLWFDELRKFEPGDEVEFEVGQRFESGETVARNVTKVEEGI